MIVSVLISLVMLTALIIGYALRHNHPESLSSMYYGMANGWMFPLTLAVGAGLLIAPMFEITPESFKFLVFLVMAGAIFVSASPAYKDGLEGPVHYTSAIVMSAAMLAWMIAMGYLPYIGMAGVVIGFFKPHYIVYTFEVGMMANLYLILILELI